MKPRRFWSQIKPFLFYSRKEMAFFETKILLLSFILEEKDFSADY
jgi:hypothetical protein